jgi:hypothetical protein
MANTRFLAATSNQLLRYNTAATFPRIANGDSVNYSSPPALEQDASFPMSNIHNPSRYLPWVTTIGGTPSPFKLHVDMGADISPTFVGFHAVRWFGTPVNVTVDVGFRTAAAGYGTGASAYTSFVSNTLTAGARDKGFLSTGTGRYWEFKFTGSITPGLSFGSLYLGTITSDMGFVYSAGATEELIHPTIDSRNGAGHLITTAIGDDRSLAVLTFRGLQDADRSKIDAVFGPNTVRDPAVWLNHADQARQVVLARGSLAWVHAWAPANTWNTDLELEVLG